MSDVLLPTGEEEWKKPLLQEERGASIMTPLGIIEGEVRLWLETHGPATIRHLTRELPWPAAMVTMALGALIRQGLVRATKHDLDVVIAEPTARNLSEGERACGG